MKYLCLESCGEFKQGKLYDFVTEDDSGGKCIVYLSDEIWVYMDSNFKKIFRRFL